ncbi:MAG: NADH-quinone oxidoreductase subunit J [Bdellovibrionota bacterium]
MIHLFDELLPQILFYIFCALAVISAFGVIALKNPVSSAFSLIAVLLNVAGVFAMQEAYFVSVVQILVYAGAIMVLFVFVIMLLSVEQVEIDWPTNKGFWPVPIAIAAAFCALMTMVFIKSTPAINKGAFTAAAVEQNGGNVRVISEIMFSDYVMPFLTVGMLLSIAVVGCVVLAKRRVD